MKNFFISIVNFFSKWYTDNANNHMTNIKTKTFKFRKTPNIKKIFEIATAMASYEPIVLDSALNCVLHPYTETSIVQIRDEFTGQPKTVNILEDPEAFAQWRDEIIKDKLSDTDIYGLLNEIIAVPYLTLFLKEVMPYMSKQLFSFSLNVIWTRLLMPSYDYGFSKEGFVELFKMADPLYLMEDDYEIYEQLPDLVEIYRGVGSDSELEMKGLSWTTDIKVAEHYATAFDDGGKVYKAFIRKEDILAVFFFKGESEIVVDLSRLWHIELVTEFLNIF